jgi:hypothetical protein
VKRLLIVVQSGVLSIKNKETKEHVRALQLNIQCMIEDLAQPLVGKTEMHMEERYLPGNAGNYTG